MHGNKNNFTFLKIVLLWLSYKKDILEVCFGNREIYPRKNPGKLVFVESANFKFAFSTHQTCEKWLSYFFRRQKISQNSLHKTDVTQGKKVPELTSKNLFFSIKFFSPYSGGCSLKVQEVIDRVAGKKKFHLPNFWVALQLRSFSAYSSCCSCILYLQREETSHELKRILNFDLSDEK